MSMPPSFSLSFHTGIPLRDQTVKTTTLLSQMFSWQLQHFSVCKVRPTHFESEISNFLVVLTSLFLQRDCLFKLVRIRFKSVISTTVSNTFKTLPRKSIMIQLNQQNSILRTFGLISMVRKSLKFAWGLRVWSFFSSVTNHCGAKWTFFNRTHLKCMKESVTKSFNAF